MLFSISPPNLVKGRRDFSEMNSKQKKRTSFDLIKGRRSKTALEKIFATSRFNPLRFLFLFLEEAPQN